MVDVVSTVDRSRMMAGMKDKNSQPEFLVRRLLFPSGYRFRLHRRDLPGTPDIVLSDYKIAVLFAHVYDNFIKYACNAPRLLEGQTRGQRDAQAYPHRIRTRGEDMKLKMIWPICLARSGGTALPICPYCSVRFPSKK